MPLDWESDDLAEGLRCYRSQRFFDAHEHWEDAWRACLGPEKPFLQALIQIAVAMHHFQHGNRVGAASLLKRAMGRLETYPPAFAGIEVDPLRASLQAWQAALAQASETMPEAPIIR